MLKRVIKFSLNPGYNQLNLSKGYKILAVAIQQNIPQVWVEVPQVALPASVTQWGRVIDEPETVEVHLNCRVTGETFECKGDEQFIGSAVSDYLVVHIYQTLN